MNFLYYFFIFVFFFVFIRASVIDLVTEYVPDNICIASYFIAICYVLIMSITLKSIEPVKSGVLGFVVSFIIPFYLTTAIYYFRYFSWKISHKGMKLPDTKEDTLAENPYIGNKLYYIFYALGFFSLVLINIITKKYILVITAALAVPVELLLFKLLKKYFVIKVNYAEEKTKEKSNVELLEEDFEVGIGGGDLILFGAIGLMFGVVGFLMIFLYSIFAQVFIMIIYSATKKMNPFKYNIPFIPAISVGLFIYISGLDAYIFNFWGMFISIF